MTDRQREDKRRKFSNRDIFVLVLRTYGASLPYVLGFVVVMLALTWFVTEVVFR
ncbi:MAG: hypothetical protein R6W77_15140 [Trueperaceae bacterium]